MPYFQQYALIKKAKKLGGRIDMSNMDPRTIEILFEIDSMLEDLESKDGKRKTNLRSGSRA